MAVHPGTDLDLLKQGNFLNTNTNTTVQQALLKLVGGALLVAGTAIGAAMLGLPLTLGASGLINTVLILIAVWFVMNCSARALLEVSMCFKGEVNLITMANKTLGNFGKNVCWLVYILLFYSLVSAYCSGGMTLFSNLLNISFKDSFINRFLLSILFIFPFALTVLIGAKIVDKLNRIIMFGLLSSFLFLAWHAGQYSSFSDVTLTGDIKYIWFAIPVVVTSFGFHGLLPSLKSYFNSDVNNLKLAATSGSFLSLLMYLIWIILIYSSIAVWEPDGLVSMLHSNSSNPADAIVKYLQLDVDVSIAIVLFSVCALLSSLLGVGLSMFDFFADGLQVKKDLKGRLLLLFLTFAPAVLFTVLSPTGFMLALAYGAIFAAILLIGFPAMMAWSARYHKNMVSEYKVFGGKILLGSLLFITVAVVVIDILGQMNILPIPKL